MVKELKEVIIYLLELIEDDVNEETKKVLIKAKNVLLNYYLKN